ncbi:MAG: mechanosensitive ion channel [Desulfuromonadaceae bacterium]|nr:mechanosensitive ion channel [Desulfuromonadaceae bacterium]
MHILTEWLQKTTGVPLEIYRNLIISLASVLVLWILRRLVLRAVWRRSENQRTRYHWQKISNYVTSVIACLLIGRIWLQEFQSVTTFLGLVSAGLAFAMKDPLVNVAGWFFIIWRRPFEVGDRIQIGVHAGDVIDLRVFQFTIMEIGSWVNADQSTGRIVHIPNGRVFLEPQINYTKGWFDYIWNEIPVLVTFESNWKKAKRILQHVATSHSSHLIPLAERKLEESAKEFVIITPQLESTVITSVEASGVLLTIRHLCEPRRRRESSEEIWEAILNEFSGCGDIDFAYPTQRFYDNIKEGKTYPGEKI